MMRANLDKDDEVTMAHFMGGLNKEIAHLVELHNYETIEDMVQMAEKIEKQLKRKPQTTRQNSGTTSNWRSSQPPRPPWQRNQPNSWKPNPLFNGNGKKNTPPSSSKGKNPNSSSSVSTNSSSIQCFRCLGRRHIASQCPNQRTMTLLDDGSYFSEDEEEVTDDLTTLCLDDEANVEEESIPQGDCLVTIRALNAQPREDEQDIQRTNIFHSKCLVKESVCMLIIDGGSCTNLASTYLVDKMKLRCTDHPRPYKLQWMNDCGELRVTKQVLVNFSIGNYSDQVTCDVIPMQASHILLGRPWEYDREATHKGRTNRYKLVKDGKNHILAPLPLAEIAKFQQQQKVK